MKTWEFIKNVYWKISFLNEKQKEKIFYNIRAFVRGKENRINDVDDNFSTTYIEQILDVQNFNNEFSIKYPLKTEKVLLDNGMDINESGKNLILDVSKSYDSHHRPKFGKSAIIGIPDSKYKIETLINLGANINIQDNDGNGILHYILSRDNIGTEEYDIFEMLIKNGININLQNNDGDTALHKISYKKDNGYRNIDMEKKVISLFIENNADKNIKNNNGKKAYPGAFIYNIKLTFTGIFNIFKIVLLIVIGIPALILHFIFYNIAEFFR